MAKKEKKKKEKKGKRKETEPIIIVRAPRPKITVWDVLGSIAAAFFLVIFLICTVLALRALLSGKEGLTLNRTALPTAAHSAPAPTDNSAALPAIPFAEARDDAAESAEEQAEAPAGTSSDLGVSTGLTAPGAQDWTVPVWIVQSGRLYHSRSDCPDIESGDARQVMIQEAVALDYFRCGTCWSDDLTGSGT